MRDYKQILETLIRPDRPKPADIFNMTSEGDGDPYEAAATLRAIRIYRSADPTIAAEVLQEYAHAR